MADWSGVDSSPSRHRSNLDWTLYYFKSFQSDNNAVEEGIEKLLKIELGSYRTMRWTEAIEVRELHNMVTVDTRFTIRSLCRQFIFGGLLYLLYLSLSSWNISELPIGILHMPRLGHIAPFPPTLGQPYPPSRNHPQWKGSSALCS